MFRAAAVLLALSAFGQATARRDPSPHRIHFVTVDSSIKLEVLDWGGTGRPILWIGCYLSAHAYDNIAPKLTDQFHVYAVTRRGIGASDRPATGYSPARRAADILEVIDSLKMERPILIGNSCGGDILHTLGARNPERIGGLMYLDAAEDPTLTGADYHLPSFDLSRLPPHVSRPGPAVVFPDAEQWQIDQGGPDPDIRRAIVDDNRVRPDYARIRVPVVAIFRTTTKEEALLEYPPRNPKERAALDEAYALGRGMLDRWEADLRAGVPTAKIVELPGANLYMFLSNEADIIRELRAFGASLTR